MYLYEDGTGCVVGDRSQNSRDSALTRAANPFTPKFKKSVLGHMTGSCFGSQRKSSVRAGRTVGGCIDRKLARLIERFERSNERLKVRPSSLGQPNTVQYSITNRRVLRVLMSAGVRLMDL